MQRDAVTFYQGRLDQQLMIFDELTYRPRWARIHLLAVDENRHLVASNWSQSFQTGSKPRFRKALATSAAERSSLISN